MWTKGIWEVTRIETDKEYVWVTCEQNCIAKIAVPKKFENEQIANAERICQCVNGWDDLEKCNHIMVEALAEIKAKIEGNPEQPLSIAEIIQGCIDELAAIAKAE